MNNMGYNLDSSREFKVLKLVYKETFGYVRIDMERYLSYSPEDRKMIIFDVLSKLDSVTNQGYLSSCDLMQYPIVSEFLPSFLPLKDEVKKSEAVDEFLNGSMSMECYK